MEGGKWEIMWRADIFQMYLNIIARSASRLVPPRKDWRFTCQKSIEIKCRSRIIWRMFNETINLCPQIVAPPFSDIVWVPWKLLPSFQITKTCKTQRSCTNLWVETRKFRALTHAQFAKTLKPRAVGSSGTTSSRSTSGGCSDITATFVTKISKAGMLWQSTTPHFTQPDQKLFLPK